MVPWRWGWFVMSENVALSSMRETDPIDAVVPFQVDALDARGRAVMVGPMLDAILERAKKFREADARVEIVDKKVEDFGGLKLHSCYLRYLLPLMVELQCYEWAEGFGAQSPPDR